MALDKNGWFIERLGERIDSFNQNEFRAKIEQIFEQGHRKIALDLQQTKFLSLPSIRIIVDWAERLRRQGGDMLLIAPSEKLKRQIGIFGSLDRIIMARSTDLADAKPSVRDEKAPADPESPALDETPGS